MMTEQDATDAWYIITAAYKSKCSRCHSSINKGSQMLWHSITKATKHVICPK